METTISGRAHHFLVDYGMFQGDHEASQKNLEFLPIAPKDLEFVVLTHAHIDHSSLIPRLCAQGFTGLIYCTKTSHELLKILLPDSAHLQLADLERAERKAKLGKWHGEMSVALYSKQEVENALTQFEPLEYRKPIEIASSIELEFHNAGHVLGSAIAELTVQEDVAQRKRYVFSGDLGMKGTPPGAPVENIWMTCSVNGQKCMRVNTVDQIWKISDILEHFSRFIPIEPGHKL